MSLQQDCAKELENTLCNVLKFEKNSFNGAVNAGFIEKNTYKALTAILKSFYGQVSDVKKKRIDKFVGFYSYYDSKSIDEMGQKVYKSIISDFMDLMHQLKSSRY